MKRFLTLLAAVGGLLFSATSCDSDDAVAVTGIELDETTLSLVRGTSHKLTATLSPADAEDQTLKWESADPTVATVEAGVRHRVSKWERRPSASSPSTVSQPRAR